MWPTAEALEDLVHRFGDRTLPKAEWTHAAHLAVGTWHVHTHGADEALTLLRSRIRGLNDAHLTPNTDTSGYHETITRAYVLLIEEFLAASPPERSLAATVQALLASPIAARDALLACYSKERLFSSAARGGWMDPDRAPIGVAGVVKLRTGCESTENSPHLSENAEK
jgi:hypothetical protein